MNEKINTKEKNVYYIGQTQDYIFLRNLKNQENLIFGKKDITNLKIGIYPNQTDIEADVIGGTRTQGYVIGTTCTPLDTQHLRKDTLFKTIK